MTVLDFPSSPTLDQEYSNGILTYVWNGTGWQVKLQSSVEEAPEDGVLYGRRDKTWEGFNLDNYVAVAGGIMTGHLTLPSGPGATNAVRKDYVDAADATLTTSLNGKVSKSGDTMTGDLVVTRSGTPANGFVQFGNNANKYFGYDSFAGRFVLNDSSLNVAGDVQSSRPAQPALGTYYFGPSTSARYLHFDGTDFRLQGASLIASQSITASSFYANGSTGNGLTVNAPWDGSTYGATLLRSNPAWNEIWLQVLHVPGSWAGMRINLTGSASFDFRNGGDALKPGGGSWSDNSDARIKNVVGKYRSGLAQIAQLEPVVFTYKGNDTDSPKGQSRHQDRSRRYIGLIAQDAEKHVPETVTKSRGYIDGKPVDDLRTLDPSALTFALINAVKELKAQVDSLTRKES